MTCEEVRLALGAHALGALDPDEALEIDLHLATCEACGAELTELEGVSAFLGKVSEQDVALVVSPPRQVLDRLLIEARAKRHRRRRALLVVAASAAVLAVGGTVWTTTVGGPASDGASTAAAPQAVRSAAPEQDSPMLAQEPQDQSSAAELRKAEPEVSQSPSRSATGREFTDGAGNYQATVTAFPGADGTGLSVRVSGVPVGTTCRLVVVSADGEREVTDPWKISRRTYTDNLVYERATRIPMASIVRFELIDSRDRVLLRVLVNP